MTELERRALLGDAEAQKECTEKGIVLSCPCCGGQSKLSVFLGNPVVVCTNCSICTAPVKKGTKKEALADWNTRSAPPIGRCGECTYYFGQGWKDGFGICERFSFIKNSNSYCSCFEPKQS